MSLYIQSSGYLYGHTEPCIVKEDENHKRSVCMWQQWAELEEWFVVKDMQQMLGRRKPSRTMPRQRY